MTSFRQLFLQGIASAENLRKSLLLRLAAPVDGASLAFFRIAFGAVLLWEVWRYFTHGWIDFYWVEPQFHFSYWGFEWIKPWPGIGMDLHWAALGALDEPGAPPEASRTDAVGGDLSAPLLAVDIRH